MAKNNRTVDRIQAVWNILGGEEGVDRLIKGEITVSEPKHPWRDEYCVVNFSVTSDGTTGEEWIKRLEDKGFHLDTYVKRILRSPEFKPTDGVMTEVVILKGMLFADSNRFTKTIRAEADKRNLTKPNAEIACLIREKFTDEEIWLMGFWWIVVMHEPVKIDDLYLLLCAHHHVHRYPLLNATSGQPESSWGRVYGFAFAVSQEKVHA